MFAFISAAKAGWAGGSQSRATMRPASSRPAALARLGLLLCLVAGSQQLSISELVVPRSQEAGQDVELQCHVDLGGVPEEAIVVKWWFIQRQERTQLYQRIPPGKPQLKVNYTRVEENDSIVLVSATPARSGEYECEVAAITPDVEQRKHAQLTVYTAGSGPQLNVSQAEGAADVDITCRVEEVAPEPDLLITIDGVEVNATEEVLGPDAAGLYSAERRVARAPGSVEGSHVQCELLYTDTNVTLHQRYRAELVYYHTGAPREQPTAAAEPAPAAATTPPSGGSDTRRVCWPLLLVLGLLAQLSALL